jgi:hypothetical protein
MDKWTNSLLFQCIINIKQQIKTLKASFTWIAKTTVLTSFHKALNPFTAHNDQLTNQAINQPTNQHYLFLGRFSTYGCYTK